MTKAELVDVINAVKAVNVEDESVPLEKVHDTIVDLISEELANDLNDVMDAPYDADFWYPDEIWDHVDSLGQADLTDDERIEALLDLVGQLYGPAPLYFMSPYDSGFREATREDIVCWKKELLTALEKLLNEIQTFGDGQEGEGLRE